MHQGDPPGEQPPWFAEREALRAQQGASDHSLAAEQASQSIRMPDRSVLKVGVAGASGFGGAELLRLFASHPCFELEVATAGEHEGALVAELFPHLAGAYPKDKFAPTRWEVFEGLDLVFLALPHGQSQHLLGELLGRVGAVLDLSADFRLRDPGEYEAWYGQPHGLPELLGRFTYGLPELFRDDLLKAATSGRVNGTALVAVPGCYPTAAALALAPLVRAGAIDRSPVVVDAASGVSGAGRKLDRATHYGTANENFTAYGLLSHRHTPEIEQATGASVLFTPHLAPMTRGILATCYARPAASLPAHGDAEDALAVLQRFYANESFVVVSERLPSTKSTWGSNSCHISARTDPRTGWVVVLSAIDNLVKGAAGQAVQCANLLSGLEEQAGLSAIGVYP
ncbi:MAG: N-acetyl-gamma-glutamyl-phosphate reductase [Actinobacteria bacterium]|nr:N-acetyl-gamma-glutamyl-phosphate reductase [Actinomycetota bacterium]